MGLWVHALCKTDPTEHLEGLEAHLRSAHFEGADPFGSALRIEGGDPLPSPFHLDWITVAFPDERADGAEQALTVIRAGDVAAEVEDFRELLAAGRYTIASERGREEVVEALGRAGHILSIRLGDGQAATAARSVARATALWFAGRADGLALDGDRWLAPPEGIEIV